ncbi:MAG: YjbH domain-containing protein [Bacteroidales bacterium]|nr:YjbH domain-containing protein [Candidatus Cacconaster merdequi]
MNRFVLVIVSLFVVATASAQFTDGMSGYLQSPSAEMYADGTFMITNNYLNKDSLSPWGWGYDTFGYSFGVSFWKRLEIVYACTIFDGKRRPNPSARDLIMFNQDRHFAVKALLLDEGEIWKWTPAIAVGISDPVTSFSGDYKPQVKHGNGYFNRMFAVATKHFKTGIGVFGVSAGYQYSLRTEYVINNPCGGLTWNPVWLNNPEFIISGFRLIGEYDSRTFNVGAVASVWRDHFDLMFEWQNFNRCNFGARFRCILK